MGQQSPGDVDRLELEAFKAVSGADYALRRLVHGLSMGTPSIETEAYLIKSRIKGVESLVTKVLERQSNNIPYSPASVRDVIGLRLLTLFKNELPYLLRRFLQFVEWSQSEPFSLFYGSCLQDAIEEIKIYATSDVHDPNVDLYLSEFAINGFRTPTDDNSGHNCHVHVDRKPSQYSSIHIVLWANGPNRSLQDRVPVEAQLRTSLEDVWGEIDHRLRYKARSVERRSQVAASRQEKAAEADVFNELKILKKNLDASSDIADLIEKRIKTESFLEDSVRVYKRDVSYDIEKLAGLDLRSSVQTELNEIVASLSNIYHGIFDLEQPPTAATIDEFIRGLLQATKEFHALLKEYEKEPVHDPAMDVEVRYRILMERALCFYWIAILHRSKSTAATNEREAVHAIKQCISQYLEVERLANLSRRPVLAFRLASVLRLRGDYDYALLKLEEAVAYLKADRNLSPNHYMRVRIPREYAFALWEAAERTKRKSYELGEATFLLPVRSQQYFRALRVTLGLYGKSIEEGDLDRVTPSKEEETRTTANNIIEYALCYLRSGGSLSALASIGLTKPKFKKYLKELIGVDVASLDRVTRADTVREAGRALGDRKLAMKAAKRVLELVGSQDFNVALTNVAYDEMREDAEAEIAAGEELGGGYFVDRPPD